MATFKYIAYDPGGKKREGTIEASSRDAAITTLKKQNLYAHSLTDISEEKKGHKAASKIFGRYRRIPQKSKADMFFQLATLIDTGIPLTEALAITAQQTDNQAVREALMGVKNKVSEGVKLSEALSAYEQIFTETYIRMIEIAEKTGKLADILFRIAKREEEKSSFNQKIAPVVLYPAFVLTLGMAIVSFLLVYVVPKMEKIFASFHKKLPFITRLLIATGVFIKHYFLAILLAVALLILILRLLYIKNRLFRGKIDGWLLNLGLYKRIVITQFTSALSFQLNADIKLTEAVLSSSHVVRNSVFREKMKEVAEKINTGFPIDQAFKETGLFDSMFIASLAMGKKTGRLADFIQRMAIYYDRKLSTIIKTTVSLVEPVAILLLGLIVGFIVMSIMVPLFNINQLVR